MQDIMITEGIEGLLSYHISTTDNDRKSLCGKHTMRTRMPLAMWGTVGKMHEQYCVKCAKMADVVVIPKAPEVKLDPMILNKKTSNDQPTHAE